MNPGEHSGSELSSVPCKEVRSDNIAAGPGVSSFDEGRRLDTQSHCILRAEFIRSLRHITFAITNDPTPGAYVPYSLSHITSRCFVAAAVSNSISGRAR